MEYLTYEAESSVEDLAPAHAAAVVEAHPGGAAERIAYAFRMTAFFAHPISDGDVSSKQIAKIINIIKMTTYCWWSPASF